MQYVKNPDDEFLRSLFAPSSVSAPFIAFGVYTNKLEGIPIIHSYNRILQALYSDRFTHNEKSN